MPTSRGRPLTELEQRSLMKPAGIHDLRLLAWLSRFPELNGQQPPEQQNPPQPLNPPRQ